MRAPGLLRGERMGICLGMGLETIVASFGTTTAGGMFVPSNPLLESEQVSHILRDRNVRVLVTSPGRLATLDAALEQCAELRALVVTSAGGAGATLPAASRGALHSHPSRPGCRVIDTGAVALLCPSGSTDRPEGVVR